MTAKNEAGVGRDMAKQSLAARLFRWAIVKWYEPQGWTEERMIPAEKKFVVIAAPHTSNWDFLYFLAFGEKLGIPLSFMAKKPCSVGPSQD
jgi:1-acyl-sn-glycerol-3-phosphate acyltransferase